MSRNVKWNKNEISSKIEIIVEKHIYSTNIIGRCIIMNMRTFYKIMENSLGVWNLTQAGLIIPVQKFEKGKKN